ncbi:MAG: hypothetical protein LQ349_007331 [Xanthoria aureola]|nr:MAG: hypothetical protein LQ349_007331 [Xanthoria aureola]
MVDMLREQRVDWQHIGNIIDSQISAQRDLHNDYTTQVAHLKEFAVRGFAQNSEKARTGLDDLLSKMQLSESKLQENEGMGTDTSHLAEKLREIASYHQKSEGPQIEEPQGPSSLAVARQTPLSERDRFSFSATLVGQSNGEVEHLVARAKMDTGCEDNWISEEILTRACLLQLVVPVETDHTFLGFGGAAFEPLGRVEITWFGVNKAKSWKNLFFVHRDGPFDMVLGSTWITEDSLMMQVSPSTPITHCYPSNTNIHQSEERLLIEKNTKAKGATASQLSSLRRAEEAAARDRKRKLKAASLTAKPTDTATTHSPSLLTAQSSDQGSSRQLSRLSTSSRISTVDDGTGSD